MSRSKADPAAVEALARRAVESGGKSLGFTRPATAKPKRPSKYRNVRTEHRGVAYDSKAEAARAAELDAMKEAGGVLWWIRQVPVTLGVPENRVVVDFLVQYIEGIRFEEVKGFPTAKFLRDVRLWRSYGPCRLDVISRDRTESVYPKREQ